MDQSTYERIKAELKAERDEQSAIYNEWRECPVCNTAWEGKHPMCERHRTAGDRADQARKDLKAHIQGNCPPHLLHPTREQTRLAYLHRRGLKGVWER